MWVRMACCQILRASFGNAPSMMVHLRSCHELANEEDLKRGTKEKEDWVKESSLATRPYSANIPVTHSACTRA